MTKYSQDYTIKYKNLKTKYRYVTMLLIVSINIWLITSALFIFNIDSKIECDKDTCLGYVDNYDCINDICFHNIVISCKNENYIKEIKFKNENIKLGETYIIYRSCEIFDNNYYLEPQYTQNLNVIFTKILIVLAIYICLALDGICVAKLIKLYNK